MNRKICIFGASNDMIDERYKVAAYQLGFEIARRGDTMIFGGGASGVMGGAYRGAVAGNGKIMGVTPRFMAEFDLMDPEKGEIIWVESMEERKHIMEENADAFVVCPGGVGTFDEFFEAVTLNVLGRFHKPVVLYNVDGFYDQLIAFLVQCRKDLFIKQDISKIIYVCEDPVEIMDHLS